MSTHLSRHFEKKRLALDFKPSELARITGCTNILKNGNRIRQFEITGTISRELLQEIAAALEVDPATIERLVELDRREIFEQWLQWANEPIQPYVVIRLIPAVYSNRPVPPEMATMEEAESWASSIAKEIRKCCCLVWNRRISCWFNEDGSLGERIEAVPNDPNVPWMRIGGKHFTFGHDLSSVSPVDWPKKLGV